MSTARYASVKLVGYGVTAGYTPAVTQLGDDAAVARAAIAVARDGLVDRELIAETVLLCAVAGEHVLVVGAPGTAKSEAVRRVAAQLGGRYFEYLLGRFTEPNEIFGPIDLRSLRDGVVRVETAGMLPEAEVVFLDEVFLGSTAVLNTLLGVLNERVFRRGGTAVDCPLRVCVGASNALPESPELAAFADRFLARVFVEPVADARIEELLESGWKTSAPPAEVSLLPSVDRLAAAAREVDLTGVVPLLATAVRRLRAAGVPISDRRAVRLQRLVAAAAVLDERTTATAADLWTVPLVAPTADAQALATDVLSDLLESASNASLAHAAEAFSKGAAARAQRLVDTGEKLLAVEVDDRDARLRIEAVLREIDACFPTADLDEPLRGVRARLAATIGP